MNTKWTESKIKIDKKKDSKTRKADIQTLHTERRRKRSTQQRETAEQIERGRQK